MHNEFMFFGFPILILLISLILFFRLGLKLKSAGDELRNNNLRQAGNIIMFMLFLSMFVMIFYSLFFYQA